MTLPPDNALPEWLDDIAQNESINPPVPRLLPDWLEDVRQGERPAPRPKDAPVAGIPPDWLEDIREIEESLRRPPPRTEAPPKALIAAPVPRPTAPAAKPLTPPRPPVSPPPHGYNPETGQIVDPGVYARWQRSEEKRRQDELQEQPTVSVTEAFLDAQKALQAWVDADANKPLVARGDMEAIHRCPAVQELLRRYEGYGAVMREKLRKRLALLVDNRQKFFKAFG